jgi:abnormal spindle-like microcephaly-associated protein
MDKQEAAFKAWLNAALVPAGADGGSSSSSEGPPAPGGLASRRLVARLRGLLWQLYSQDQEMIRWVHGSGAMQR